MSTKQRSNIPRSIRFAYRFKKKGLKEAKLTSLGLGKNRNLLSEKSQTQFHGFFDTLALKWSVNAGIF